MLFCFTCRYSPVGKRYTIKQSETHRELEARVKAFEQQESEFYSFLEVREVDVAAKEQDMKDRIQEVKNAAFAAIIEVRDKHPLSSLEPRDIGDNKQSKLSSPNSDNTAILTTQIKFPHKIVESDMLVSEVKLRPELMEFCSQNNAKGLLSFIVENHKIVPGICDEVSVALKSASEPGQLQAKTIADVWKPKLVDAHAANENSLEVEVFLQLLVVFRIASKFDDEELCKLALELVQKRQMPELFLSLGLADKVTTEELRAGGRHKYRNLKENFRWNS
ncbi:hypothetical protein POM88_044385 [Heracleum sosnowskyi]|uniref:FRIGIDA-like protein n=1 Tax=Heracleum sosnowskyi TaxID=360622 RepID=A0AAD8M3X3_9APIA|nr:hypothetical protein POM88_044385 [Heracleum sosnowskyi]